MKYITGKKVKMTQVFKDDKVIPVTVIAAEGLGNSETPEIKEGDKVKVSGTSKGRGFQGVVKRYGFHGGPKTHGQKNRLRAPGSIGSTAPQKVYPGRRMAGRMGGVKITVKNLRVVEINKEKQEILLQGAVPGNRKGKVKIYPKQ
ncbi:MAG: 50S ribosomal protein L3 [Candidatus Colwellbacteria bacterium RIFCSPLOWO2_12_FULL_44_13]|uniref:Large ribosomal subunit protein uL3 n=3 Tax=Candidatus Colwelliibacteriota TaxID=1817904 RepID=A0A1G1Z8V1_9BACT|nr:MAG: 50S ribosomal protein L3 [Candidatus Colwellbacteria bacterium RIFCSPHIGHO2_12_FULL_44_17]OGY60290.1 MAG: 50S ribosomal protein L3 [Candidatus Colwellbacteria bacterium RIFCSPLOWO2_02_FULL_44_20b]OGY61525.1 MAG: 50S ribosomal protein L3 [Candidatus Colwellbacteria bacterium RIFCSPLOWO2_12_FULL_44_13]